VDITALLLLIHSSTNVVDDVAVADAHFVR
jgi:hypothetical protein